MDKETSRTTAVRSEEMEMELIFPEQDDVDQADVDQADPRQTLTFALRARSRTPVPTHTINGKLKSKTAPGAPARIYRIDSPSGPIKTFTLQVSDIYAGSGTKQSSTRASGYISDGEGTALDGKNLNDSVRITYREYGNGVDLYDIRAS